MALLAQHWQWLFTTPACKGGGNVCLGKEEEVGGSTLVLSTAQAREKALARCL